MPPDDEVPHDPDAGEADAPVPAAISPAVRAYFERPETLDLVRRIVCKRVFLNAPEFLVEDIQSDAVFACLSAKAHPTIDAKTPAWVAGVTVNVVRTYFRNNAKHARWLNREVDVDTVAASDLGPEVLDDRVDAEWLLEPWLVKRVEKVPTDRQTLEIIRHKARTKQTDEQIVAHFGLSSVSALSSRVHYFKKKYLDRRQRYLAERRRTWIFWLKVAGGVAALLALGILAYELLRRPPPLEIHAEPPVPSAVPSASASAGPPPFDQALPTQPPDGLKPRPPKP